MPRLETERLIVLPFTLDLKRLALRDRAGLASRIDAGLPDEWPNPDYAEVLPFLVAMAERDPARDDGAWSGLILHRVDRVVIGEMGCKGGPDAAGTVEIGYGIIPAYRGQGYATEAVGALVDWAVRRPGVSRVVAACEPGNAASIRVLEKVGMRRLAPAEGMLRWELRAAGRTGEGPAAT